MRTLLKSTLLGAGFAVGLAFAASAQGYYYPWYYPEYSYGYAVYPYATTYPYSGYGDYGYGYGYPWYYGTRSYYPGSLAYSDPYVHYRPYSDRAGPAASGHTGY